MERALTTAHTDRTLNGSKERIKIGKELKRQETGGKRGDDVEQRDVLRVKCRLCSWGRWSLRAFHVKNTGRLDWKSNGYQRCYRSPATPKVIATLGCVPTSPGEGGAGPHHTGGPRFLPKRNTVNMACNWGGSQDGEEGVWIDPCRTVDLGRGIHVALSM